MSHAWPLNRGAKACIAHGLASSQYHREWENLVLYVTGWRPAGELPGFTKLRMQRCSMKCPKPAPLALPISESVLATRYVTVAVSDHLITLVDLLAPSLPYILFPH